MKNKNIKSSFWKDSRTYFMAIFTLSVVTLVAQIFLTPILPINYIIILIAVLAIIFGIMWLLLYNKRVNNFNRILGKIIISILSIFLIIGNVYYYQGANTLNSISGADIQTDAISVIVLKENNASKITDLKNSTFGKLETMDKENTDATIDDVNKQISSTIKTSTYKDANSLVQALYDKKVDVIIMNEAYRGLLEDKYPNFDAETKVIYQHKMEKKIEDISKNVDVTKNSFNVFISGIDTYGPVSSRARSDVNMLATVNPITHKILLTSIPRDYYVTQVCQGNQKDKLTHAGIFGVDCSVSSIETLFNAEINYYARVNFTSLINIVDSLGGISVDNPNYFTTEGTVFPVGVLDLNGEKALQFSRERYSFSGGDRERGKNQMRVITGIINKAISPSIITNYSSVMSAISGSFETNMDSKEITKFIQKQLSSMSGWEIIQNAVDGTGGTDWTPANGFDAYVMYPDQTTVDNAKTMIEQVLKGN